MTPASGHMRRKAAAQREVLREAGRDRSGRLDRGCWERKAGRRLGDASNGAAINPRDGCEEQYQRERAASHPVKDLHNSE